MLATLRTPTFHAPSPSRLLAIAASMTHARQFESALHASTHDALTSLPNRRAFEHRLATELERHRRYGEPVSLVMLDLDGFKRANDTLGYAAGDAVLRAVGELLRSQLRTLDAAYRLGGDEFAVILPHTTEAAAEIPAARCMAAISAARLAEGLVGVSYGLAGAEGDDAAGLCARADARLYEVKRRNKAKR